MNKITLKTPDDWHCHLRDGVHLQTTVPAAAREFKRVVVMPNLVPPVLKVSDATAYRDRILAAMPTEHSFTPLMALYLSDSLTPDDIRAAKDSDCVFGYKLYPQGVTTNAQAGIAAIEGVYPLLETLSDVGLPLMIHGEVSDPESDIFDREKLFIEKHLAPMVQRFPKLKIVLEHITTQAAVAFVQTAPNNVAATITPHHLLLDRNALFQGGLRPHHYCLPILKRRDDQAALIKAATSGNPKFFLGTDSAPHVQSKKEADCGCAGIYHGANALVAYAEAFDRAGALDKLEDFASKFGAAFYGTPQNTETVTLIRKETKIPDSVPYGDTTLIPFWAGNSFSFTLENTHGR